MKELSKLFLTVYSGSLPSVFNALDDKTEQEERLNVERLLFLIKKIIEKTDVAKITAVLSNLESLESYINWIEHPIYLNEFRDKKGNRYLQGRTSIKGMDGKTKWVSAYVGSLNEYPKGINDPEAFRKAKPLIRKKLKKYFGLE